MPQAVVRNPGNVGRKWAARAASAQGEYQDGVQGAGQRWQSNSAAAHASWQQGVTAAAGRGAYGKGIQRAGAAKYTRNATEKGPARYAQGVAVGEADYHAAVTPFLQAIASVDLPARGPAGSEGNYARVAAIGKALRKLKESR
jgi:hypothetical protein